MTKRPPIGIYPRFIFEELRDEERNPFQLLAMDFKRFLDIRRAIYRYYEADLLPPQDWAFEDAIIRYSRLYSSKHPN